MDNMLEHPGSELQALIKEKGLTQKAFASILGKKVSEVNELLKGKRNITIQRDYLLHQTLGTPIKYWILKQVDYDYSLLDIEESPDSPILIGEGQGEVSSHQTSHSEHSEESISDDLSSGAIAKDLKGDVNKSNTQDSSSQTSQNGSTDIVQNDNKEPTQNVSIEKEKDNISEKNSSSSGATENTDGENEESYTQDSSSLLSSEGQKTDEEDHKKRANIFKSF